MRTSWISVLFALGLLLPGTSAWALVNLNTASPDEIAAAMKGVGASKAEAVVKERETNGKFGSLDEVAARVKGIGPATIEKNKDKVTVE